VVNVGRKIQLSLSLRHSFLPYKNCSCWPFGVNQRLSLQRFAVKSLQDLSSAQRFTFAGAAAWHLSHACSPRTSANCRYRHTFPKIKHSSVAYLVQDLIRFLRFFWWNGVFQAFFPFLGRAIKKPHTQLGSTPSWLQVNYSKWPFTIRWRRTPGDFRFTGIQDLSAEMTPHEESTSLPAFTHSWQRQTVGYDFVWYLIAWVYLHAQRMKMHKLTH